MNGAHEAAVRELAERVAGAGFAGRLAIRWDPGLGRGFRHRVRDGRLELTASDPVSACAGLHDHLRQQHGTAVHWPTRTPLDVPLVAEAPERTVRARVRDQYMLNFCTFSYSTAHWSWPDWEREIDWMALHGVTMPLALTGHEAVLADVYRRFGCDDETILGFLGEPLYLPFQYMGCRDGHRVQLTADDLERRARLGRRIIERMRSLGMTPVLPGFTGHVPQSLAPDASRPRRWQDNTTWFLDPGDARFARLATEVVRVQQERFGAVTHIASDPFIETPPADEDDDFPTRVAGQLVRGFRDAEPDAVWVLQAWPFAYQADYWTRERVRAFLDAVPHDALYVLDLWAEHAPVWPRQDGFAGRTWQWCGLLNFGGRSDAVADLPRARDQFEAALASPRPPAGLGLTMESIHHNGVFFELLADLAWGDQPDLDAWGRRFAADRYGRRDDRLEDAWSGLLATIYDARGRPIFPETFHGVLMRRPTLAWIDDPAALRRDVESQRWFDADRFARSWRLLVDVLDDDPALAAGPLGLDLVELAQAACSRIADELVVRIAEQPDPARRRSFAERLSAELDGFDELFATRAESRLDTWEDAAARAAADGVDPAELVGSARRLVTSWNETPRTTLEDYSGRLWRGLVGGHYNRRLAAWAAAVELAGTDRPRAEARLDRDLDDLHRRFVDGGVDAPAVPLDRLAAISRRAVSAFTDIIATPPAERTPHP